MSVDLDLVVGLFPGQGAYRPGALSEAWLRRDPPLAEIFAQIDEVAARYTGEPLTGQIFSASPPSLEAMLTASPDLLQLAIFGQSVAAFRLMTQGGARFSCLVGHSLGEISALACAGAFTVRQGAEIIYHRTVAVRRAGADGGQMLALGTDRDRGEEILHLLGAPQVMLACDNGPRQIVVSGPVADLQRVAAIAAAVRVSATVVRSPAPFHNPMLASAQEELTARIRQMPQGQLRIPVYSPIVGRGYRDTDDLPSVLGQHLVSPVRFGAAVDRLYDVGARIFVEAGAGSALTGLAAAVHPDITVLHPLSGPDDRAALAAAVAFLTSQETLDARDERPEIMVAAQVGAVAEFAAPPPPPPPPAPSAQTTREEILRGVRALYAEALEYPEEVLTEEAEFEAHLGVDSLKQVEMLNQLGHRYAINTAPEDATQINTIGKAVDFIYAALTGPSAGRAA